jgi:hypothetical protein
LAADLGGAGRRSATLGHALCERACRGPSRRRDRGPSDGTRELIIVRQPVGPRERGWLHRHDADQVMRVPSGSLLIARWRRGTALRTWRSGSELSPARGTASWEARTRPYSKSSATSKCAPTCHSGAQRESDRPRSAPPQCALGTQPITGRLRLTLASASDCGSADHRRPSRPLVVRSTSDPARR